MDTLLLSLLRKRSAYRAFSPRQVEPEKVQAMLEAAQLSASCFNNQPWRFLVLEDPSALGRAHGALADANYWAKAAPLLMIGFSRRELDCLPSDGREYFLFDLGMATQNILLQAAELGLVARPMAGFRPAVLREAFRIPDGTTILVVVAIGYPGDLSTLQEKHRGISTAPRTRNPLEKNFFFDAYPEGADADRS
ncbi:MAG: nitroreductase family protein [bacterium]